MKRRRRQRTRKRRMKEKGGVEVNSWLSSTHLGELAVSKPLQPPHAVAGLPLAGGPPGDHDAGPPGETLDLSPHQLTDTKAFVILLRGERGRRG